MVSQISAKSPQASRARQLVEALQRRFADGLWAIATRHGEAEPFASISWLRDEGRHGGGTRLVSVDTPVFNRAAINVSSVHYDDDPNRRLGSATALSTIIHPQQPQAPSVHIHISWTEMRDDSGYWRIMADLNPAIENRAATARFRDIMRNVDPEVYQHAAEQGGRYFFVPALERHRGVTHYYLERYSSGDLDADFALAERFGNAVTDGYCAELDSVLAKVGEATEEHKQLQLVYHTLYVFQVLTLDRGTTSGLLVHAQNDVGILGSLPCRIDRSLFASWASRVDSPQDALVRQLVAAMPDAHPCALTDEVRARLAAVVRDHYRAHPEALAMQASGDVLPPTVDNHLAPR